VVFLDISGGRQKKLTFLAFFVAVVVFPVVEGWSLISSLFFS